jgi:hypothetical protein
VEKFMTEDRFSAGNHNVLERPIIWLSRAKNPQSQKPEEADKGIGTSRFS